MNSATLSLSFSIGPDDPLGTLEMVLATARRGGVSLSNMHVRNTACSLHIGLLLNAPERERLELFALRLNNLIEVSHVNCQEPVSEFVTHVNTEGADQLVSA